MTLRSSDKTAKAIHVFTSDVLPFPGGAHSAGSVRSMQIISALRAAGHRVTFSMPLNNYLATKQLDQLLSFFTSDDIWRSKYFFEPEVVVNSIQPDCVIYCNVNTFRAFRRYSRDVVNIFDLNGPLQLEGFLIENPDTAAAERDGVRLEASCRQLVERLREADYLMTVSERQKYFWSAYASLAGFSLRDLGILSCPPSIDIPTLNRKTSPKLSVVYAGGFYPWQNPDRFLRATAKLIEKIEGATLHIFGAAHAGLPNEDSVKKLIAELQRYRCVKYYGYRPAEELREKLSSAWCAIELMEQNLERELALTGRTIEFLSVGTPVIYNNYSTFSKLISSYNAGWTLSTEDTGGLQRVFDELLTGGRQLVDQLSSNAYRLAQTEFSAKNNLAPLVELCAGDLQKRGARNQPKVVARGPAKSRTPAFGKVLGIVPGVSALLDLRLGNPLRGLQRQGYIEGFSVTAPPFDSLKHDITLYDAVAVQRTMPEAIYMALVNSSVRFLLDVDDNLLAGAAFRNGGAEPLLVTGLRCADALTTPNPRLVKLLEKYSGMPLAHKAFITPNALPYPADLRASSQPTQIIWIQSDIAALTASRESVLRSVEEFSKRHQLPIVLIGRNVLERPQFTHQMVMGEIDFTANLQFLEFAETSIGVAPLETNSDQETLDFIAGKSDLKILLFNGYGHPGVFSDSPPYGESALRCHARVIANTYADWTDALDYQYREGWRTVSEHSRTIREERHMDRVCRESWIPALESVRLTKPIRGKDFYEIFRSTSQMADDPASRLGYLAKNHDVAFGYVSNSRTSWDHYEEHGRLEGRQVMHDAGALNDLISRLERESSEIVRQTELRIEKITGGRVNQADGDQMAAIKKEDIAPQLGSEVDRLEKEVADLRGSYSWKVTEPLRRLARVYMERNRR